MTCIEWKGDLKDFHFKAQNVELYKNIFYITPSIVRNHLLNKEELFQLTGSYIFLNNVLFSEFPLGLAESNEIIHNQNNRFNIPLIKINSKFLNKHHNFKCARNIVS